MLAAIINTINHPLKMINKPPTEPHPDLSNRSTLSLLLTPTIKVNKMLTSKTNSFLAKAKNAITLNFIIF